MKVRHPYIPEHFASPNQFILYIILLFMLYTTWCDLFLLSAMLLCCCHWTICYYVSTI